MRYVYLIQPTWDARLKPVSQARLGSIEMFDSYTSSRLNKRSFLTIPALLVVLTSLMLSTTVVHAQSPDFALSSTPSNLCVNPGVNGAAVISVQSVDNFIGSVNLAGSVDPNVNNGPTISQIPSSETLAAGQTIPFDLSISTSPSTPVYTYSIRISGLSGGTYHETTVQVTVAAGCSVGGVVLPTVELAATTSYVVYGLIIAGLVGIVGATLAIRVRGRKHIPNP